MQNYKKKIKTFQSAIKCNFRYEEEDQNYPLNIIEELVERSFAIDTAIRHSKDFICDDDNDVDGTNIEDFIKNRFNEASSVDDDELHAESLCSSVKKTIRPKALPSVRNNELLTVVNHGEYSQTVTIEECE